MDPVAKAFKPAAVTVAVAAASLGQRVMAAVALILLAVVGVLLVGLFLVLGVIVLAAALVIGLVMYVRFRLALRAMRRRALADLEAAREEERRRRGGGAIDAPFRVEDR